MGWRSGGGLVGWGKGTELMRDQQPAEGSGRSPTEQGREREREPLRPCGSCGDTYMTFIKFQDFGTPLLFSAILGNPSLPP